MEALDHIRKVVEENREKIAKLFNHVSEIRDDTTELHKNITELREDIAFLKGELKGIKSSQQVITAILVLVLGTILTFKFI